VYVALNEYRRKRRCHQYRKWTRKGEERGVLIGGREGKRYEKNAKMERTRRKGKRHKNEAKK
jgi:hypothetical protein